MIKRLDFISILYSNPNITPPFFSGIILTRKTF